MKLSTLLTLIATELANPNIANLRTAVFGGRAQLDDLRSQSWTAGAGVLIAWTGIRQIRNAGSDAVEIVFQFAASASLPGRAKPAPEAKLAIADLTQAIVARLTIVEWPDDVGRPTQVRAQNLYALEDSKNNLARSVVFWEQEVRSKFNEDAPELPPLELLHHEQHPEGTDPAPIVTDIEVEQ